MRVGQTTMVVFISKLVGSAVGFITTLYFARVLGSNTLGQYFLILSLVGWIAIFANLGMTTAITKRMSEGEEQFAYFWAGVLMISLLGILLAVTAVLVSPWINDYVGSPVAGPFVSILIPISLIFALVRASLEGQHLVHVSGLLQPIKTVFRSIFQISLVFIGLGLTGIVLGYAAGTIIAGTLGIYFLTIKLTLPAKSHFISLYDFAKYSWVGKIQSKTYSEMDILILGLFVSSSLVGIYGVAWSLAAFLSLFGGAITSTIFPEISQISSNESPQETADIINDALSYAGLIVIPGQIGGLLMADELLLIYGPEFVEGSLVLIVLIAAVLLYSFEKQCMTSLKAIGRPDIAFWISVIFLIANVTLNVLLINIYGIIGAAIATLLSVSLVFLLSYWRLSTLINFSFPIKEVSKQIISAGVMGFVVFSLETTHQTFPLIDSNFIVVIMLVGIGAVTYFVTLLLISSNFRNTVDSNLPVEIPLIEKFEL